jgi:hypothetical protein
MLYFQNTLKLFEFVDNIRFLNMNLLLLNFLTLNYDYIKQFKNTNHIKEDKNKKKE